MVRVSVDRNPHAPISGAAGVHVVQIQAVRIGVDFERGLGG